MLYLTAILLSLFSAPAQAEPCPTYNELPPKMVVDVAEYKFFFFPREANTFDPDIVLVEKGGEMFDLQKVNYWADYENDETVFHNKNISITCTYGLSFVSARYQDPYGKVTDYLKGDCREADHDKHPLRCD